MRRAAWISPDGRQAVCMSSENMSRPDLKGLVLMALTRGSTFDFLDDRIGSWRRSGSFWIILDPSNLTKWTLDPVDVDLCAWIGDGHQSTKKTIASCLTMDNSLLY